MAGKFGKRWLCVWLAWVSRVTFWAVGRPLGGTGLRWVVAGREILSRQLAPLYVSQMFHVSWKFLTNSKYTIRLSAKLARVAWLNMAH